jgi:hypothetical protein
VTLFCKACKTEVTCNRTTINSHCISQGHHRNVECRNKKDPRLERVKDDDSFFIVKEGNIISDRDRGRLRTETEVIMALLINNLSIDGVLSNPANKLRQHLERAVNCQLPARAVNDKVDVLRQAELDFVKKEVEQAREGRIPICFDGTIHNHNELLVIVVRFVNQYNQICHRVGAFKAYAAGVNGAKLGHELAMAVTQL